MSSRSQALSHDRPPLSLRSALIALSILGMLLVASGPVRALLEQRAQVQRLAAKAAELEAENSAIRAEIARLKDPAVLEQLARECLGMVRPGETAVVRAGDAADC
ncbi:MAG: FtsB family cell division protein [Actinomycetota bacterium]